MQIDFRTLLTKPPRTDAELLRGIRQCVSIFEPERVQAWKPAPEEDIQNLERLIRQTFGRELPSSFKMYLQQMGEEDGGLLSKSLDYSLGDWNYFKGRNLAWGAARALNPPARSFIRKPPPEVPSWFFFYAPLMETGWGFSAVSEVPDELVKADGRQFFRTHDTFSRLLFFCAYQGMMNWPVGRGKALKYKEGTFTSGLSGVHVLRAEARCPEEWLGPGYRLAEAFCRELEEQCSLSECWFSSGKCFCYFDGEGRPLEPDNKGYEEAHLVHYAGFHTGCGLTVCINFFLEYGPVLTFHILSEDLCATKQLADAIFQRTERTEDCFSFTMLNDGLLPARLRFCPDWS